MFILLVRHLRLLPLFFMLLAAGPLASRAAGITLVGRVCGAARQPLPGVIVTLRGVPALTTTNAAGDFLLSCDESVPVLVFKYAGYQTQTVLVKEQGRIAITLYPVGVSGLPPSAGLELVAEPLAEFDEAPAFMGGPVAYQKFLRQNLHYPEAALARDISGSVLVGFVVDEQGHILDAEVVKGCDGLNEEALRLVRLMPWWTPARRQGQPVRASFYLRIKFALVY